MALQAWSKPRVLRVVMIMPCRARVSYCGQYCDFPASENSVSSYRAYYLLCLCGLKITVYCVPRSAGDTIYAVFGRSPAPRGTVSVFHAGVSGRTARLSGPCQFCQFCQGVFGGVFSFFRIFQNSRVQNAAYQLIFSEKQHILTSLSRFPAREDTGKPGNRGVLSAGVSSCQLVSGSAG